MTTIILHGYLRELYPQELNVEATSAAEALYSLNLIPALTKAGNHHVHIPGFESRDALYDRLEVDVINVHPVMAGSGKNGTGQIILGVILIAVALYAGPGGVGMITQGQLLMGGAMMVLGGILQALAPQPKLTTDERGRYLGAGKNTVAIGTRIPMIYGRCKTYGHYVSFDIDSGKFDAAPAEWYSSPFTNSYGEMSYSAADADLEPTNPQVRDYSPTSTFSGLSYPDSMVEENTTYITFTPVSLLAGVFDLSFATGQILHVENPTAGTVSKVTLLGGEIKNLPALGTAISFSRNYE